MRKKLKPVFICSTELPPSIGLVESQVDMWVEAVAIRIEMGFVGCFSIQRERDIPFQYIGKRKISFGTFQVAG